MQGNSNLRTLTQNSCPDLGGVADALLQQTTLGVQRRHLSIASSSVLENASRLLQVAVKQHLLIRADRGPNEVLKFVGT